MQTKVKVILPLILVYLSGTALADRPLERDEVLEIFRTLTSQPMKTWLVSGTIQARHEEYRAPKEMDSNEITDRINQAVQAYLETPTKTELTQELQQMKREAIPFNVRYELSNECNMSSNVTVRFDGNRFYWEIVVDSRTDSVRPGAELAGNSCTEEFDLDWNQKRVFAWDGEKYTVYFRPGNHAIIRSIPSGVNGPLTAGIVPWGYGRYSYRSLSSAQSSATELQSATESEIRLTVTNDSREETFVLDSSKGYALRLHTTIDGSGSMVVRNYRGYRLASGRWLPGDITIEQYDTTTIPATLMASDVWDFVSITNGKLEPTDFDVDFEYDTFVEDFRFGSEPLQYRYSPPEPPSVRNVNVDELLQNRLQIAQSPMLRGQNCATISLRYVCGKLGVNVPWEHLEQLVHGSDKRTSLFEMKEYVDGLGLNSLAVEISLEKLRALSDYQVILHLPRDNHYVVLGNVSDDYVRLIDLDKNDFHYRSSIEQFVNVWDNAALIVADKSIGTENGLVRIDENRLHDIIGAATCQACNTKIQDVNELHCLPPVQGRCGGTHEIIHERWRCGTSTTGTCLESDLIRNEKEACIADPNADCIGNGDWTSYNISACK